MVQSDGPPEFRVEVVIPEGSDLHSLLASLQAENAALRDRLDEFDKLFAGIADATNDGPADEFGKRVRDKILAHRIGPNFKGGYPDPD